MTFFDNFVTTGRVADSVSVCVGADLLAAHGDPLSVTVHPSYQCMSAGVDGGPPPPPLQGTLKTSPSETGWLF